VAEMLFKQALEAERAPKGVRMIGARTLLGSVQLHAGKMAVASMNLERALAEYENAPQMFAAYVNSLTLCALGDVRRLEGRYDEAVANYVRARALLEPAPEMIGAGYLMVRLHTRLATTFFLLWMRRDEIRNAESALDLTRTRRTYSFNWCWLVSEGSMHYDWPVYHATRGDSRAMSAALDAALKLGWRELALIDLEPAFAPYRAGHDFRRQLQAAADRAPLPPITPDSAVLPARDGFAAPVLAPPNV
jgi:tetratricopeptide (TPR) repeat protein